MRKTLIAASIAVALSAPSLLLAADAPAAAPAAAPASPHTFTGNLTLANDYRFRGISQTFRQPTLQGGVDYSHTSGFYVGNWNSNVNQGAGYPKGNLEMDFYGGFKVEAAKDLTFDLGTIYYYYPGTDANTADGTSTTFTNPKTNKTMTGRIYNHEVYLGATYKWFSIKYNRAVSDYFSLADTKGSGYLDLSGAYDLGQGWGLNAHVGAVRVKNYETGTDATKASYNDWKLGVTKDIGGWVLGLAAIGTNARGKCTAGNQGFYCFSNNAPATTVAAPAGQKFKDAGTSTAVLSVTKSF